MADLSALIIRLGPRSYIEPSSNLSVPTVAMQDSANVEATRSRKRSVEPVPSAGRALCSWHTPYGVLLDRGFTNAWLGTGPLHKTDGSSPKIRSSVPTLGRAKRLGKREQVIISAALLGLFSLRHRRWLGNLGNAAIGGSRAWYKTRQTSSWCLRPIPRCATSALWVAEFCGAIPTR
jgi:hypothetical protein